MSACEADLAEEAYRLNISEPRWKTILSPRVVGCFGHWILRMLWQMEVKLIQEEYQSGLII